MTADAISNLGDTVAGKYAIEGILGRGGMGVVYQASHVMTGRRVAIKRMLRERVSDEARERFFREAQAVGRIHHPNVIDIYDVGEDDEGLFLVMEFLHGESLGDALERFRLSAEDLIYVLMPALRGIHAAHQVNVIHRDLKPDNIFLCRGPDGSAREAKVLDFGISKLVGSDRNKMESLTQAGALIGTPYYMAPEQVMGSKNIDARTDVYALGVILFEGLSGHLPFESSQLAELLVSISTRPPQALDLLQPGLPPTLVEIVHKAIARDPDSRFASVEALGLALEPFAGGTLFRSDQRDPTGNHVLGFEVELGSGADSLEATLTIGDDPAPGLSTSMQRKVFAPTGVSDEPIASRKAPRSTPRLARAGAAAVLTALLAGAGLWALGAFGDTGEDRPDGGALDVPGAPSADQHRRAPKSAAGTAARVGTSESAESAGKPTPVALPPLLKAGVVSRPADADPSDLPGNDETPTGKPTTAPDTSVPGATRAGLKDEIAELPHSVEASELGGNSSNSASARTSKASSSSKRERRSLRRTKRRRANQPQTEEPLEAPAVAPTAEEPTSAPPPLTDRF